jgi:cytochrome c oxidase subunit 2
MWSDLPLFPEQASTVAGEVDNLYFFLIGVSGFFTVLIFVLISYFAVRYRRRSHLDQPKPVEGSYPLEIFWTVVPLFIVMIMFGWGASLYFRNSQAPPGAMEIYIVGKQWMWKAQHPDGPREINELHVPAGTPVHLIMTSEDVIHSFYIPAFRIKQDVLPGRYTNMWFQSTKPGKYHLFCAEYCGNQHSGMIGWVHVLTPAEYEEWLDAGRSAQPMASAGKSLFDSLGCGACHEAEKDGIGPALGRAFGRAVTLENGQTVTVDEGYLRESILDPTAKVVAGFAPVMPTFQGQISEDQLNQLISFIKSLRESERTSTQ